MNKFLGVVAIANLALVGALGYIFLSERESLTDRMASIESSQLESSKIDSAGDNQRSKESEKKMAEMMADFETMKEQMGVTSTELKRARATAQALKRQQEESSKQLAAKANSSDIDGLRQETTTKITAFQEDSSTKIGNVSGEVDGIKKDLASTRDDWGRQLVDVKNALGDRIAKNSTELAELRKNGERDYFEFDIRRVSKQPFSHVGDIQLALLKTDPKNHKYNIAIEVDDQRLEKKDRTANEPIQFLVGQDKLRYEVVVNSVDKDRIRGYLSVPKDKVLASNEPPRLHVQ